MISNDVRPIRRPARPRSVATSRAAWGPSSALAGLLVGVPVRAAAVRSLADHRRPVVEPGRRPAHHPDLRQHGPRHLHRGPVGRVVRVRRLGGGRGGGAGAGPAPGALPASSPDPAPGRAPGGDGDGGVRVVRLPVGRRRPGRAGPGVAAVLGRGRPVARVGARRWRRWSSRRTPGRPPARWRTGACPTPTCWSRCRPRRPARCAAAPAPAAGRRACGPRGAGRAGRDRHRHRRAAGRQPLGAGRGAPRRRHALAGAVGVQPHPPPAGRRRVGQPRRRRSSPGWSLADPGHRGRAAAPCRPPGSSCRRPPTPARPPRT